MRIFIRTKDRIDFLRKGVDKYIVKDSDYTCEITIDEETLLKNYKVADTIEELCDGFYIVDGQELCFEEVFTNFDKFKSSYEYYNKYCVGKYDGYGFIKTSKGLIFVAKMNKKGDLELI